MNRCGICGSPAVTVFNNLRETAPVRVNGEWWDTWEIADGPHYRCWAHGDYGARLPERRPEWRRAEQQQEATE